MSQPWQEYQEEVGDFFRSLGCDVEIEKEVAGARGIHAIDVVATRATFGIKITWIVECKLWRTSVPKEKVLALAQISSDVGADRAFLLSESGFQSGAIRAAACSNITLTSIDDLRANAHAELEKARCNELAMAFHKLQSEMHTLFDVADYSALPKDGGPGPIDLLSEVFQIKHIALPHVQNGEFPVRVGDYQCADITSFIAAAETTYVRVVARLSQIRASAVAARRAVAPTIVSFMRKVTEFLDVSEMALFSKERQIGDALASMEAVGAVADELRKLLGAGLERQPVARVMAALIDGSYLLLANPKTDRQQWASARIIVERRLADLQLATD